MKGVTSAVAKTLPNSGVVPRCLNEKCLLTAPCVRDTSALYQYWGSWGLKHELICQSVPPCQHARPQNTDKAGLPHVNWAIATVEGWQMGWTVKLQGFLSTRVLPKWKKRKAKKKLSSGSWRSVHCWKQERTLVCWARSEHNKMVFLISRILFSVQDIGFQ